MKPFRHQLLSKFLPLLILPVIIFSAIFFVFTLRNFKELAAQKLSDSLNGAELSIARITEGLLNGAVEIVNDRDFRKALLSRDLVNLRGYLGRSKYLLGLDVAKIFDLDGHPLIQINHPIRNENDRPIISPLKQSAYAGKPATGIERTAAGIGLVTFFPLHNEGKLLGVLELSRLLDYDFLSRLKDDFSLETVIFDGSRLQATTMTNPNIFQSGDLDKLINKGSRSADQREFEARLGGIPYYIVTKAISSGDRRIGTMIMAYSNEKNRAVLNILFALFGGSLLVFVPLVIIVCKRVASKMTHPLEQLSHTAEEIANGNLGNLEKRNLIDSSDEINLLATSFTRMSDTIKKQLNALEQHKKQLEREIAERQEGEKILIESEKRFRTIFEHSNDSMVLIDTENSQMIDFNHEAHTMLGYRRDEFRALCLSDFQIFEVEEEMQEHIGHLRRKEHISFETKHRKKDGHILDIAASAKIMILDNKERALFVFRDMTMKKKSEASLRLSARVFESATEAILVTDPNRKIISVNPAFTEITGYTAEEVIGQNPGMLKSGKHDEVFYAKMSDALEKTGYWKGEIWDKRKNGKVYPQWLSISTVKNPEGEILQYIALFSDITKQKENEKQLHIRAYYDSLTHLPNRELAFERLTQTIRQDKRYQRKAALFFVDLDHFKQVNDTLGHLIGDRILVKVAQRLTQVVRESDTVARTGGDEFIIILSEIKDQKEVRIVAKKINEVLAQPFQVGERELVLGASIGITMIPDDGNDTTSLLKNADMAMYKAKLKGRNNYQFFNKKMEKTDNKRTLLEWDLRHVIENQELILHYQPIVDLSSLETVSLEALVRWRHPLHGLIPPDQFIPLAENSAMISKISKWVLLTACSQVNQWRNRYGLETDIAVNLSSRDFLYGEAYDLITNALEKSTLPAKCLIIEVTENLMLNPNEEAIKKLQTIKELGVRISIDDFGTGYSSLSYLARYPIDLLKIDKSFIDSMHADTQKKALVEAIIRMGQSMGMKIIAEGVETYEDLTYLKAIGCDKVQGYYFSKPLSAEAYEAVLKEKKEQTFFGPL